MSNKSQKLSSWLAWSLLVTVWVSAFIAWASNIRWQLSLINIYILFPLLGLWAWSTMWTHYAIGALSLSCPKISSTLLYKKITYSLVLGLILLHPGLLAYAQWHHDGSLPPGSELKYVSSSLRLFVVFGFVALFTFIAYEVLRRLSEQPLVKKFWSLISLSQMAAMSLIFIHSLKLGQNLQSGWFRIYWLVLGILLIPCFVIVGKADWHKKEASTG